MMRRLTRGQFLSPDGWTPLLAVLILLLAFGLRVHLLGAQSFWNDEGSSYVQATRSLAEIAFHAGRDIHPPGYYWLLALWRTLAGESEYALRLLSVFASLLTIAFTAALGRRLFGRVGGLSAALFVALNSFSIYYAQEARMYALLAVWGTASLWLLAGLLRDGGKHGPVGSEEREQDQADAMNGVPTTRDLVGTPFMASVRKNRYIIALGLVNAAGLYTQYAYFYVLLTQAVVVALWLLGFLGRRAAGGRGIARPYEKFLGVLGAQVLAFGLFLPWLPTALVQIGGWPNTGEPVETAQALNLILNWLIYGMSTQDGVLAIAWLLMLFGLLMVRNDADARRLWHARHVEGDTMWMAFLPAIWVTMSVGVFLAQGLFRENNLKFLLPAQAGMALWLGRGVAVLWEGRFLRPRAPSLERARHWLTRFAALATSALIVAACWRALDPLYHDPAYQRSDYRSMARLAEAELDANDAIILNGPNQSEVFNYYYHGPAQVVGLPAGLGGDDLAAREQTQALIFQPDVLQIFALFWGDRERDPNGVVEGVLDTNAYSLSDTWYGDVRLARYLGVGAAGRCAVSNTAFQMGIMLTCAAVPDTAVPGEPIAIALEWRAQESLGRSLKVFVQLLAPGGQLVAQHDGEPTGGARPTTTWQADELIRDGHALIVPADAPSGEYTLIAGIYAVDPPYARLTLPDGSDHVVLGRITVE